MTEARTYSSGPYISFTQAEGHGCDMLVVTEGTPVLDSLEETFLSSLWGDLILRGSKPDQTSEVIPG